VGDKDGLADAVFVWDQPSSAVQAEQSITLQVADSRLPPEQLLVVLVQRVVSKSAGEAQLAS
jgi:hypothetical protein